jgi:hypothetical protein
MHSHGSRVKKNAGLSLPAAHGLFGAVEILQRFGNASFLCDANVGAIRNMATRQTPAIRMHFRCRHQQ